MAPPRSAFGASPSGGTASGPAKPDPRRLLGWAVLTDGRHRWAAVAALLLALSAPVAVAEPSVTLAGQMGSSKALLMIDGKTFTLGVGERKQGVKLLALESGVARIEWEGRVSVLQAGGAPLSVGSGAMGGGGREIVISMGPGGHFVASGNINGKATRFMVDTGATMIAMGKDEAERLGVDYKQGQRGMVQTANGTAPAWRVTLSMVTVGEVTVSNVEALVTPASMPMVLLGNSFLSRFQMRRDNDVMRLELR